MVTDLGIVIPTAEEMVQKLEENSAGLVSLDIKTPGNLRNKLLSKTRISYPETAVDVIGAVGEVGAFFDCPWKSVQDHLPGTFNLDEVLLDIERAMFKWKLELEFKRYEKCIKQIFKKQSGEFRRLSLNVIDALVLALETKDRYTAGHSRRVKEIAIVIGQELGLSSSELEDLCWGALLHDIGKIAIDPRIQNKPGKLTPEEYRHIMLHVQVGTDIARPVANEESIAIIRHHHDYYDGNGLFQTVRWEDIPFGARILTVADVFDAMVTDGPYRSALSTEEALVEIERCSGTQFDPHIVTAFLKTPILEAVSV